MFQEIIVPISRVLTVARVLSTMSININVLVHRDILGRTVNKVCVLHFYKSHFTRCVDVFCQSTYSHRRISVDGFLRTQYILHGLMCSAITKMKKKKINCYIKINLGWYNTEHSSALKALVVDGFVYRNRPMYESTMSKQCWMYKVEHETNGYVHVWMSYRKEWCQLRTRSVTFNDNIVRCFILKIWRIVIITPYNDLSSKHRFFLPIS